MDNHLIYSNFTPESFSFQPAFISSTFLPEVQITPQVTQIKDIYICHYDYNLITNTCKWLLTTDLLFASQTDADYELASYDDLYQWMAATNEVFSDCVVKVIEGNVKFVEESFIDFCGNTEWKCEYEFIWN